MNSFNLIAVESNQLKSLIEESVKKVLTDSTSTNSKSHLENSILTREMLARKYCISKSSIYRRMKDGTLPHFHIGRRVYFDETAISNALMGGQNETN